VQVFECEQGSAEWWDLRAGVPTASEFSRILKPKTCKPSTSQEDYICDLIAQKLIGTPEPWVDSYQSPDMKRGTWTELEARRWFQLEKDMDVQQVGFCLTDDGKLGCSPDGLLEDSGLELKAPAPKTQIRYLLDSTLPDDYRGQVHGSMIVTGRPSWWFMSYCPGLPPLLLHIVEDEYTALLRAELARFLEKYDKLLAQIVQQREEAIDAAIQRKGDQLPDNLKAFVA
jgi:hypothetical protein